MNSLSISESQILSYLALPKLPQRSKKSWTKAVVTVIKADATSNYAVARCDNDGSISIIKDFGTFSPIVRILDIRPYEKKEESR